MRPRLRPPATLVSLVSRHGTALYSGSVPALVAGLLEPGEAAIDLRRLCALTGVAFLQAEIVGLDPQRRELRLAGRPPLRFDRLSLDVGAVTAAPAQPGIGDPGGAARERAGARDPGGEARGVEAGRDRAGAGGAGFGQPVKPLEPFLAWLDTHPAGAPVRIRGGGAAAVELALALKARGLAPRLLLRGERLRLGSPAAERLAQRLLEEAAILIERRVPASAPADLACTGSRAPHWLAASGLPVDPTSGRVLTEASLEVLGHRGLFAAGDCALIAGAARPPSGVWAVRAAPWLAENLHRSLQHPGAPLRSWRPQGRALQLLGDGGWSAAGARAVALWGPLAIGPSPWLWRWKQRIDRRFLERFVRLGGAADPAAPMACRGCAAKLAAGPLEAALARLDGAEQARPAEDAAPIGVSEGGRSLLQSVDGFPALVADPWLNARLTTLHACGDLWACGAEVESVQALVTVPEAAGPLQEELLLQTLAGVRSVLDPLGARLVGGHTLEGRDGAGLALALSVNGRAGPEGPWPKGPLRPGDVLLLCGSLGSGVLFAAAQAGAARPDWIQSALERMQRCQAPLVQRLAHHGCRACTDITGFGLLGHLGEMLVAAPAQPAASVSLAVELWPEAIAALPGSLELLERGWASSLAAANARSLSLLEGPLRCRGGLPGAATQALLIDPQTCGPLLAALPADRAAMALEAVQAAGFSEAAVIGRVLAG